ncbi:hypothetical protein D9Q98_003053 [Chlorella vulgaris]|uniref:Uncharacterized protein n=1 Tax=Chlorella vulgaris TaxID=3077 RepID=A0A9D4TUR2_CHLVU|nr:hypothetical protein D9Q98_003053 [Chlorella vulgaris]
MSLLLSLCPALSSPLAIRCRQPSRRCRVAPAAAQQLPERQRHQPTAAASGLAATALALASSPGAALAAAAADPQAAAAAQAVYELAALDSKTAGSLSLVLKPVLSIASLLMIVRIVMSWYPELDGKVLPWSIAYTPTEPLLVPTRKLVPPFNGLDVSPIVWVALLSFLSEILTGPQGILSLIARKGI